MQKLERENLENNIAKSVNKQSSINKKKKKNKNIRLIVALVVVLCIVLGVLVAVVISDKNNGTNSIELGENKNSQAASTLEKMLEEEGFVIETPIVNLYYPEKHEKQVRVEQIEGDVHTVQFFAKIKDKEEVHLFDITFGEEDGVILGTIEGESKEQVLVNIVSYDFEPGDDWTEEDASEIYIMLEDINYIIGMLQKEESFVPAS